MKHDNPQNGRSSVGQSQYAAWESADVVVRIKRPDGRETWLRIPGEHWERVVDLAAGEFGDKSIIT
jgi:hypothetical protein